MEFNCSDAGRRRRDVCRGIGGLSSLHEFHGPHRQNRLLDSDRCLVAGLSCDGIRPAAAERRGDGLDRPGGRHCHGRLGILDRMAHYDLAAPLTEEAVRKLRVDDSVSLNGTLFGIRDATQIHMFDRGRKTRFDLSGHAVIHTAPNVKKVQKSAAHPAGYAPLCVGTTTSDRMERFTRPLMQQCGVRLVIGKGGLREESLKAFGELGGAYLAIIGGTAALETTWVESIEDVDLDDLNPESLWKFRVRNFGPLLVAMDSHGGSLYSKVKRTAQERRAAALRRLGVR